MTFHDFYNSFVEQSLSNFMIDLDLMDIFLVFFWSLILGHIIAFTYRMTHREMSYSQNFTQSLVLISVIVAVIMLIVGTNIARALAFVGTLSIVRFRNSVRDSRDLGFIFFIVCNSMICGIRFFPIAMILTAFGCGLIFFMSSTQFGQNDSVQTILEMDLPVSKDYAQVLAPIFGSYLEDYSLLYVDSLNNDKNRLCFLIKFKKKASLLVL
ncbi:MAG: DUF4956 domain-containing protein, partial [Promethearchaeota archaeon]